MSVGDGVAVDVKADAGAAVGVAVDAAGVGEGTGVGAAVGVEAIVDVDTGVGESFGSVASVERGSSSHADSKTAAIKHSNPTPPTLRMAIDKRPYMLVARIAGLMSWWRIRDSNP